MVGQSHSPLKRPFSEISDSDSEWEYEYSTTETEAIYVTLDLSSHSGSALPRPAKRKPKHVTKTGIPDNDRPPDLPEEQIPEPCLPPSATEEERIQILDLTSESPVVSYRGTVYSCTWTEPLGTDVLLQAPPANAVGEKDQQPSPVLAWSRLRLVAKPMKLVPHAEERRPHKDDGLADGTKIPSTRNGSSQPADSPTAQLPVAEPLTAEVNPSDALSPDLSSAPTPTQSITLSRLSMLPTTDQLQPSNTSAVPLEPPPTALAEPQAPHSPKETPATTSPPQQTDAPTTTSTIPSISPPANQQPQDASPQHPASATRPPSPAQSPLPTNPTRTPSSQATFLSRLTAAKLSRNETDTVPLRAPKPQGTGWRAQGRRSHHGPGAATPYVSVRSNIVGYVEDGDSDEEVLLREEQLKAMGLTKRGKKIGRPRGRGQRGSLAGVGGERGGASGGGRGTGRGSRRTRGRGSRGGRGAGEGGRGWETRESAAGEEGLGGETPVGEQPVRGEGRPKPTAPVLPGEEATANVTPPLGERGAADVQIVGGSL